MRIRVLANVQGLLAPVVGIAVGLLLTSCRAAPPPEIGPGPAFELVNERGEAFGSSHLRGKIWVANFIFTSCPDVCPILTQTMKGIQKDLDPVSDDVFLISITVDPVVDTPEVLRAYAESHGAEPSNWSFLTGSTELTEQVVVKGFQQALEEVPPRDGEPRNIRLGSHFVLLDRVGTVSAFYPSNGKGAVYLVRDAQTLVRSGT